MQRSPLARTVTAIIGGLLFIIGLVVAGIYLPLEQRSVSLCGHATETVRRSLIKGDNSDSIQAEADKAIEEVSTVACDTKGDVTYNLYLF
jgi:hypothetical protein